MHIHGSGSVNIQRVISDCLSVAFVENKHGKAEDVGKLRHQFFINERQFGFCTYVANLLVPNLNVNCNWLPESNARLINQLILEFNMIFGIMFII
jgi:hypothetical protein